EAALAQRPRQRRGRVRIEPRSPGLRAVVVDVEVPLSLRSCPRQLLQPPRGAQRDDTHPPPGNVVDRHHGNWRRYFESAAADPCVRSTLAACPPLNSRTIASARRSAERPSVSP